MTEQAILNRIHKLEMRQCKNGRIIHKLYRKLRILQNQTQPIISNEN